MAIFIQVIGRSRAAQGHQPAGRFEAGPMTYFAGVERELAALCVGRR
jgi:hypothetical protein